MSDQFANQRVQRLEIVREDEAAHDAESLVLLMRRVFRGRHRIVLPVVACCGVIGAAVLYRAVPPVYESTGWVCVEGALPVILRESEETRVPPLFEAFAAAQATYLQSREVLDAAVMKPDMRHGGWPSGEAGVAALQRGLSVRRGRGEQMILVSVRDGDPRRARAAVDAVLGAYRDADTDPTGRRFAGTRQVLTQHEAALKSDLRELERRLLEASDQVGLEAVSQMRRSRVDALAAIGQDRAVALAGRWGPAGTGGAMGEPIGENRPNRLPTTRLTRLKDREMALTAELKSLQSAYGWNHPRLRELRRQREAMRIEIGLHERALVAAGPANRADASPSEREACGTEPDRREVGFPSRGDQVVSEMEQLGRRLVTLEALNDQVEDVRGRLAETRRRLDELTVEGSGGRQRVRIAQWGDLPLSPVQDRRAGLAVGGALLGVLLSTAFLMVCGSIRSRIRYVGDLAAMRNSAPVLAVLPDLRGSDRLLDEAAALSIHQMRNLLETEPRDASGLVLVVLSGDRGEGSTSITWALGMSFAAGGRRTLIIDADIAGAGLSNYAGLRSASGLCEAIGPERGGGCVHETGHAGLWVMPVGRSRHFGPEELSRASLDWLLDALRGQFDAILIDGGAVLGSVDASLMCAAADRVVMTVKRGTRAAVVGSAFRRLAQHGVEHAAVVFNRAERTDCVMPAQSERDQRSGAIRFVEMNLPRTLGRGAVATLAGSRARSGDELGSSPRRRAA